MIIPISLSHKEVIKNFFEIDIKMMKKYYNGISYDFDDTFHFQTFKDFIYAAAGMFKDLDMAIYNQELVAKFKTIRSLSQAFNDFEQRSQHGRIIFTRNFLFAQEAYKEEREKFDSLKAGYQMLIAKEKQLTAQRTQMEAQFKAIANSTPGTEKDAFEQSLKKVRREQVDTIHTIGENRLELDTLHGNIKAFEDEHREDFLEAFAEAKEKIAHQYSASLDYYGFEFNEALFRNSENSKAIQKFKSDAGIEGKLNLCKYAEYHLRNVVAETLANAEHKDRLLDAKRYCEKINR